ncbi:MAG TPA: c-type cytochrome [Chthoniobacteraceae bacterium]|nr:c-type cytochrome [Chthoniobacteraceae bacterium]
MKRILRFFSPVRLALACFLAFATAASAQTPEREPRANAADNSAGANSATPISRIKAAKDFKVELLYSVPASERGSWVNLCVDDKGRIITSDQYGGLYRFAPPAPGQPLDPARIEKVPAEIRAANGLLWAFGALYVAVNDYENKIDSGLYRVTDSDGDDQLDKVEKLRAMKARGDHGVHAIVPTPDGKSLFLITGNGTTPTEFRSSRVPLHWGEDHLLPRMPDGRGFMRDVLGPGGIIYRVSPDGKDFEVWSSGYRNIFDAAVNRDGELFTYDADMEYDFNTPWYRPTRICHATSGSEWGWRNGAGKWPVFYPDTVPPVLNIGPGSPTGATFGYAAKFPARYQEALFVLDWSWGRLYAVFLQPQGSSYVATKEEFVTGSPLPLSDAIIHPQDGAMYFAIGGRKVQSGLYRVTYTGGESTAPVPPKKSAGEDERALRRELEALHSRQGLTAVTKAWPHLAHRDRFIGTAARVALEHQPVELWVDAALTEPNAAIQLEALLALARVTGIDPTHRKAGDPPVDRDMQVKLLAALLKHDWKKLDERQRITLVRTYEIVFNRFGAPDEATTRRVLVQLDPAFPAATFELNWLLCETLVFLQSPTVAAKAIALIQRAPTQEEQMEYARSLRMLRVGWNTELRTAYFEWLLKAASVFRGGASFDKFIEFIRTDAEKTLTESERIALKDVLARKPVRKSPLEGLAEVFAGRTTAHNWTLEELALAADAALKNRDFARGRKMFAATGCFACHRLANEGGMMGPDLTGAGGRYNVKDLLDQIINPSKEINEQFAPTVVTKNNGEVISGVIMNLHGDGVTLNTDLSDPNQQITVNRKQVKSIELSKVSPMPPGLLNLLTRDEVLDLAAYVLSGGDASHTMFEGSQAKSPQPPQ